MFIFLLVIQALSVTVVYDLMNEKNSIYLQAAFLLPVLTGMMKQGLTSSSFSPVQEPQALVVAPTRELAVQIFSDAKRFTHGTMLRPVVLYGGTSLGHQLRNVEQGSHIVVGTPGRLIDVINKGKVIQFVFNGLYPNIYVVCTSFFLIGGEGGEYMFQDIELLK